MKTLYEAARDTLIVIESIASGSTTANSLPNLARIAREGLVAIETAFNAQHTAASPTLFATKRVSDGCYGSWLHKNEKAAWKHLEGKAPNAPEYTVVGLVEVAATQPVSAPSAQPELTVWYGPMPESNGKSNFTATLMRKGASFFDADQYTFARSEYPDRVRYEADFMRYLIGELAERPFILDYDADKHSGYKAPTSTGAAKADGTEGGA